MNEIDQNLKGFIVKLSYSISKTGMQLLYAQLIMVKEKFAARHPDMESEFETLLGKYFEQIIFLFKGDKPEKKEKFLYFIFPALSIFQNTREHGNMAEKKYPQVSNLYFFTLKQNLQSRVSSLKEKPLIEELGPEIFETQNARQMYAISWCKLLSNGAYLSGAPTEDCKEGNLRKTAKRIYEELEKITPSLNLSDSFLEKTINTFYESELCELRSNLVSLGQVFD